MFRSARDQRTFLTLLLTHFLDMLGYSIAIPVLTPFLLSPELHYFAPDASVALRTTILGLLFSLFGIAQFIGAPFIGTLADYYGRYKIFLATIGIATFGYLILTWAVFTQSLFWVFVGRTVTGFCSGNFPLAQSAAADMTEVGNRSKVFGVLMGSGSFGWIIGPWFGGKLANPEWLSGSAAFLFAAIASAVNALVVLFFFTETWKPKKEKLKGELFQTFKDLAFVFHHKVIRNLLITYFLFALGWAFYLIFAPTFLVQKFSLGPNLIGDIYAYLALVSFFVMALLNKELNAYFSIRTLLAVGLFSASLGAALFLLPPSLWYYWIVVPVVAFGGGLCWTNLGAILSKEAPENMQGRALGVGGSMWSMGQVIAPLCAGVLAGWNMYSPLTISALLILIGFCYFLISYKGPSR